MLLRFGLTNFTSFRDATELSFVATAQADEPTWRLPSRHTSHGVLPVLGVWGANAAGKSNLLNGLMTLRHFVRDSFTEFQPSEPLPWFPFAMHTGDEAPPTQMDLDLLVGDTRYHYGFRYRASGFTEEWLYAWPKNRRVVLFHRDHSRGDPWYFGPSLGGQRHNIAKATRPNSLFLSTAAQYEHAQLSPVYAALAEKIRSETPIYVLGKPLFRRNSPILDPALRDTVVAFITAADIGVIGVRPVAVELDLKMLAPLLGDEAVKTLSAHMDGPGAPYELRLRHGSSESSWELPPEMESRGTNILLRRLEDLLQVLRDGGVLVLDELDTSLHPDLCGTLVDMFTTPATNPKGAQLVFTTHDGGLLSRLRRDEVVLIDKARDGASTLRTASDYSDVRGRDDLARAYALGRIRGVPALGDLAGILARGLH